MLYQLRTEWLPPESSAIFLFTLQTCSVLLLPQLPPLQVTGTLQTVHSGSQEDNYAARHQLGSHPTLQGKKQNKVHEFMINLNYRFQALIFKWKHLRILVSFTFMINFLSSTTLFNQKKKSTNQMSYNAFSTPHSIMVKHFQQCFHKLLRQNSTIPQGLIKVSYWAWNFITMTNIHVYLMYWYMNIYTAYHDSMGKVAVGLALQPHSAELSCHVAFWSGFVQGRLSDTSHLSGHKEGQHTLQKRERKVCQMSLNYKNMYKHQTQSAQNKFL